MTIVSPLVSLFDAMLEAARALRFGEFLPPPPPGRLLVLGAGKAAALMARQAEAHYAGIGGGDKVEGFVVVPYGYGDRTERIKIVEASHPLPDATSRDVGLAMLDAVKGLSSDDHLLMLMSGGASSLLVVPRVGVALDDKRAAGRELLRSGLPISLMNGVRKRLSAIKGGRLALAAAPARVTTLIVSDVPGDDPADVGSGPTIPDAWSTADILSEIDKRHVTLSPSLLSLLSAPEAETPFPDDPRLPALETHVVLTGKSCFDAVERKARSMGFGVLNLGDRIEGEARVVARAHADIVKSRQNGMAAGNAPLLILSGGETSVTVRGKGRGGRNTEYLLALGLALEGLPFQALAADTDGIDGTGPNAGAYVDAALLKQARSSGTDLEAALENNDSLAVFEALDSLVVTGATRTNVNDFRAILLSPQS